MRESNIEKQFCQGVKRRGGMALKWVSPGFRGVPDRIVVCKGEVLFVEFKAPGKSLSKLQKIAHAKLAAQGVRPLVISSIEEVIDFFNFSTW